MHVPTRVVVAYRSRRPNIPMHTVTASRTSAHALSCLPSIFLYLRPSAIMNFDKCYDILHEMQRDRWVSEVAAMRKSGELADEKVAMEVEALMRIRQETNVPVPKFHGWGTAANNPLSLGPFIIMDFIEGVSLESLWKERPDKRLIRSDISEADIEYIYRQFAQIQLKLFQLNFERIGSLPTPLTNFVAPIRPLTFKVHYILQMGGVNTFGRSMPSS